MITRPGMQLRGALAQAPRTQGQIRPPIPPLQRPQPQQAPAMMMPYGQNAQAMNNAIAGQPGPSPMTPPQSSGPMYSQSPMANTFPSPVQPMYAPGLAKANGQLNQQPDMQPQLTPFQQSMQSQPTGNFSPQYNPGANAQLYQNQIQTFK